MELTEIINFFEENKNPINIEGMKRFAISSEKVYGISAPVIKDLAKKIKKNHSLAIELWETGIYEARALAALIADPKKMTPKLANKWVADFDSWAVCDNTCGNLFDKMAFRDDKIFEWAENEAEFVRRAAFATIAYDAVHNKKRNDEEYLIYFPILEEFSNDGRNFVKKAVNWAIRQIGKRSKYLNSEAIKLCNELLIKYPEDRVVRWICNDAIKELTNEKIINRLKR